MAEPTSADASDAPQVPEPKSKKLLLIIVVALLTSVLAGGGAYWFATKGDHEASAEETDGKSKAKSKSKAEKPESQSVRLAMGSLRSLFQLQNEGSQLVALGSSSQSA